MKLLFDANLSPKLAERLADLFPGSQHVVHAGLAHSTSRQAIWDYAAAHDFTIVTADSDVVDFAESCGGPPQVVRLDNCNYRTARVEALLRQYAIRIGHMPQSGRSALVIRNVP